MLGLASCQNEPEGLNIVTGGEMDTVVTVNLPEATRASSADSGLVNVDPNAYDLRYILEVYDAAGDVFVYRAVETRATNATNARTVTFPVRLIPERSYNFVVWADFVYKGGRTDLYYNTLNNDTHGLNAVTIADGKWVAMDEARDAYTAVEHVDSYNSGKSINLTLVRPFGKLRVITTDIEALNALANNALPKAVKVTYTTDVYSGFNALTQDAIYKQDETTRPTFEYALDNAAVYRYTDTADSKMVLFTDYIFGTENGTIQFELTATYANGNKSTNNFNTEIPIVRNYLTTISGNILTDGNDIRVDITDDFENGQNPNNPPYYQETISSAAEFYAAVDPANAGKKYIVISALNLTSETISTLAATRAGEAATTTTIDLNGYTITVDNKNADGDALITLGNGQTIVFEDTSANGNGSIVLAEGSQPLFDATQATVVVEGGSVEEDAVEGNFFVNNGSAAESLELLQYICANGGEFTFSQNLEGNVTVYQKAGQNVVINGNGFDFNGTIYVEHDAYALNTETLTIRNINFVSTVTKDFIYADNADAGKRYVSNVTIEDCTFTGAEGADVVGVRCRQAYNFVIKNCEATKMHSLGQITSTDGVLIENVTFEGASGLNFLTSVKNANIVNCTINATKADGYGIRSDANNDKFVCDINVKNCNITANTPIWVRRVTVDKRFKLALEGNTLTKGGLYHVVFTSGDKDLAIPTVSYEITGAENYSVFPTSAIVTTADELVEALENKASVKFANDIKINPANMSNAYGKTGINVKHGQTIDGAGHTLDIKGAGGTWDSGINTTGGLIKNLTVTGSTRGIFINHTSDYSEKVVLENVTLTNVLYTISCDQGLYQTIEATNCTFNGWTSYAKTAGEAKFISCSFGEGSGYKYCRPYSNTEFVNCTFCPGYAVDTTQATVTFTDCTWEE